MPWKTLTALLFLLLTARPALAQDPVFSQFYAAPLRLNPALAGIGGAPRVNLNYRSQHTTYPSAYTTVTAGFEQPVNGTPSNIGLRLMTDAQLEGIYRNTEVAAVYSYDIRLSREFHARLGLSAGFLSTRLDFNRLVFGDILDPLDGPSGQTMEALQQATQTDFDFGAGVVFYAGNTYGGLSLEHLNRPGENLLELNDDLYAGRPQRLTVHAGTQIDIKRYSNRRRPAYITPNFLFSQQSSFRQLNVGAFFGYGDVAFGTWYRHAFANPDGLILAANFRRDALRFGFSYDTVYKGLRALGNLGPTFELSLGFDLARSRKFRKKRFDSRYQDCFGMFR